MAPHIFASAILKGEPIKMFNRGRMRRDFTYIDDAVDGLVRLLPVIPAPAPDFDPAAPDPASSSAPWRIYNVGNNRAVELGEFVALLEAAFGKKAERELLPMQPGDVEATFADIQDIRHLTGFSPQTPLSDGIARFAAWHKEYYA